MIRSVNPGLTRLEVLIGEWELTASAGDRIMSLSRSRFEWFRDRAFLVLRTDPPTYLAPEWVDAAPAWVDGVIGLDDYTDKFTMLYADSRGVSRTYRMIFDANRWTMTSRPGEGFYQRFESTFTEDRTVINGRWEASTDDQHWTTDFDVTFRRVNG